ncbi:hypothetical protein JCGZ_02350 [Jatropha curcas]|uniref:ENTH domain-containing protein n=1 Tax=Jatropha curcas TaxID=180498 RepID=A0A067KW37_JATCU|nr:epsin-3 [Jatropha curcas]KDP40352.1 hypothetical protein JCGZ_02350 [Jatropha curcas]
MGTLFLNQIKRQASSFLQEKYKNARLALTDVSRIELLAEEATNNDPWGPVAKTMTIIAEASYGIDDYWRIVDVLHRRFDNIDWKEWRQCYKSLVLLEFLLTHGPEEFAVEFQCDSDVIDELGTFKYIDNKGFDWGANMQKRSDHILKLLEGGDMLKEERLKAIKITKEIHGFGSLSITSPRSPSSATSGSSRTSSSGSYSFTGSLFNDPLFFTKEEENTDSLEGLFLQEMRDKITDASNNNNNNNNSNKDLKGLHMWDCPPIQETGSLLNCEDDGLKGKMVKGMEKQEGSVNGICLKLAGGIISPRKCHGHQNKEFFRSISDVGKLIKKKYDRQFSLGY